LGGDADSLDEVLRNLEGLTMGLLPPSYEGDSQSYVASIVGVPE